MDPLTDDSNKPKSRRKTTDVKGAADILGVSESTVRRLVDQGELRHLPITGRGKGSKVMLRFRESDLDAYLDRIARGGSGTPIYAEIARGRIDGQFTRPDDDEVV